MRRAAPRSPTAVCRRRATPTRSSRDPAKEAQAQGLMETLRCLVCQGQSIADSDAEMAGDMRALVRAADRRGARAPAAIRALAGRALRRLCHLRSAARARLTAPLWIAPLLLLGAGAWLARGSFKRRRALMGWLVLALIGGAAAVALWLSAYRARLWQFARRGADARRGGLCAAAATRTLPGHPGSAERHADRGRSGDGRVSQGDHRAGHAG